MSYVVNREWNCVPRMTLTIEAMYVSNDSAHVTKGLLWKGLDPQSRKTFYQRGRCNNKHDFEISLDKLYVKGKRHIKTANTCKYKKITSLARWKSYLLILYTETPGLFYYQPLCKVLLKSHETTLENEWRVHLIQHRNVHWRLWGFIKPVMRRKGTWTWVCLLIWRRSVTYWKFRFNDLKMWFFYLLQSSAL